MSKNAYRTKKKCILRCKYNQIEVVKSYVFITSVIDNLKLNF